ncbi:unnamed protein product, partial [marine sediment metagenome]
YPPLRLRKFFVGIVSWGLELLLDIVGKAAAPKLKPFIDLLEATGKVPPELQPILEEIKNPSGEVSALFAQSAGSALVGGAIGKVIDGILLPLAYAVNSGTQNVILTEGQYTMLWLRKFITDEKYNQMMHWLGHDDTDIANLKEAATVRLTPEAIARLWLRDKPTYEYLWKDLADSGLTPDRIKAMKELAYAMPTPNDIITFMAKEALEEDMVDKYGLDAEDKLLASKWWDKAGVHKDARRLYWRSHWVHPAFREMTDMLHRGEITDADLYEWYRLV